MKSKFLIKKYHYLRYLALICLEGSLMEEANRNLILSIGVLQISDDEDLLWDAEKVAESNSETGLYERSEVSSYTGESFTLYRLHGKMYGYFDVIIYQSDSIDDYGSIFSINKAKECNIVEFGSSEAFSFSLCDVEDFVLTNIPITNIHRKLIFNLWKFCNK